MNQLLITAQLLREFGACSKSANEFNELFPQGIDIAPLWADYQSRINMWTFAIEHPFFRTILGWAMENAVIPNSLPSFYMGEKDLTGLDLSFSNIYHPNFTGSILKDADFVSAHLAAANFARTDLSGADFRHSYLRSAIFTNADLSHANFSFADLRHSSFFNAKNIDPTKFHGAVISNSSITSMDLPRDKKDLLVKNVFIP